MLSSASSATESTDPDTGPGAQDPPGLRAPEPQFSELIDGWLAEGDRLNEQATTHDVPPPPATRVERWRQRAIELGRTALERHRLELLVAIGLLPLLLFLITQGGGRRRSPAPRAVPVALARHRAPLPPPGKAPVPASKAPAPAPVAPALVTEGLLRQCTAGPALRPPATAHRTIVHRHHPVARPLAHAPAPAKVARKQPPAPRRR